MGRVAGDVMQTDVRTVGVETTLAELDRAFLEERVSGFPVVQDGRMVGLVSRSDVVRQLGVEQSVAETISDYYRDVGGIRIDPPETIDAIARQVGARIEKLRVKDVMVHDLITVTPTDSLQEVAQILVEHRIHRLPVVEAGRLLGILTSLDLVRLLAEGHVKPG
ncbi:MAG: CBS domain-containing protein [Myxococcales bacterium]|nr:CBS domain-containing protein [Myxococcales bacterium]